MVSRHQPDRRKGPPPPLDAAAIERLALRYVERFATTRGRLVAYLQRKLRERGLVEDAPPPDVAALAQRIADLGYIDDRAFGEARAAGMARRGLGARRVTATLRQDGLDQADRAAIDPGVAAASVDAALAFARRKRIGPFALVKVEDRALREKQLGALLRAGHGLDLARRILAMAPGEEWDRS